MHRCIASLLALLTVAQAARAADVPAFVNRSGVPIELRADSVSVDSKRSLYEARGSVVIQQGERVLHADWVVFNEQTGRAVASGNVLLDQPGQRLAGSFLEFDVYALEGVVFGARLETPGAGFQVSGAEIARTGDTTYRVRDGVFTTCRCPEPGPNPWQITAEEAEVEIGGYGTARNTTFDVLEVPVVWFPWMLYPVKTERQTGLLIPEVHIGRRSGVDVGLPFFWAARPDLNVTLTPHWLSKRGFKGNAELEYVLGQHSGGRLAGSYLHDQDVVPSPAIGPPTGPSLNPATPYSQDRWSVLGEQDLRLPEKWRFKSDFAFASDNDFPLDFDDLEDFRSERFLDAQAVASRSFGPAGRFGAGVGARYSDDLQNPDDRDRDRFVLQRLPTIELAALPAPLPAAPWLVPALDVEYAHFWPRDDPRDVSTVQQAPVIGNGLFFDTGIDGLFGNSSPSGAVDPFENDGRFEEGEPLADQGSRLDLWPRLGVPLRLFDLLELKSEAGWRQTFYATEQQSYAQRGFFTGLVELRTRLRGELGDTLHVLEPQVAWTLVSDAAEGGNPLFVPRTSVPQERVRQLELSNVLADPADRVEKLNALTYGFVNRFYRRGGPGVGPVLLADVALSNQLDLGEQRFRAIVIDGRAYPFARTRLRFDMGFDPHRGKISEGLAELTWSNTRGDAASLGYRYLRSIPVVYADFNKESDRFDTFRALNNVKQLNLSTRVAITERWSATYAMGYSFEDSFLIRNRGSIEYFSKCQCFTLGIAASDDRTRGFVVRPVITVVGLGRRHGLQSDSSSFLDVF